MTQRITRAKRKIAGARIPYRIPGDDELPERLNDVLTVIYLLFNEGYLSSTRDRAHSRDLVDDAEWLTALLAGLLPNEPEVTGLLALIRLHRARVAARFTSDGQLVLLQDQNRADWDHAAIADATALLTRTARRHRSPGTYQLQAAIAACHCEAPTWAGTDWKQILVLYDMLLHLQSTPVTRLHRAVAVRYVHGPRTALTELDDLATGLGNYPLFHAIRAELLRADGRPTEAHDADRQALERTTNPAQLDLLHSRLTDS